MSIRYTTDGSDMKKGMDGYMVTAGIIAVNYLLFPLAMDALIEDKQ